VKVSWKKHTLLYRENPGGFKLGGIDERMIRYAEVLLMMAECENETGNPDAAIDRLNEVRARPSVNMPAYPTARFPVNSQQAIRNAIIHEKRVELAGEHIRNRDILRWRRLGHLATEPISYFEPKYERLPIPQTEIDANDKIDQGDQNSGY
jgi:starch-binding outer membrane protein, SusD/RagB family